MKERLKLGGGKGQRSKGRHDLSHAPRLSFPSHKPLKGSHNTYTFLFYYPLFTCVLVPRKNFWVHPSDYPKFRWFSKYHFYDTKWQMDYVVYAQAIMKQSTANSITTEKIFSKKPKVFCNCIITCDVYYEEYQCSLATKISIKFQLYFFYYSLFIYHQLHLVLLVYVWSQGKQMALIHMCKEITHC